MNTSELQHKELIALNSHSFYFGHYLNMARHNAYLILWDIRFRLTGEEKPLNEALLHDVKLLNNNFGKKQPDLVDLRNKLLIKHFPFLNESKDENIDRYKDLCDNLKHALELLNVLRNCCSHVPFVEEYTAIDLQQYYNLAIEKAEFRMSDFFALSDFDALKTEKKTTYLLNENDKFTLKGLCFFMNLFLEKKYAFQFLGGIAGFKNRKEKKFRATLEVFTELCCRLPYPKLVSSDFKLDMLNELSRCPAPLFQLLDKTDQKAFVVNVDNESEFDHIGYEEYEGQQAKMIRFGNRFPYFALQYFDQTNMLGDISFHINIGRWIKKQYKKEHIEDRKILRNVRTMGKLPDYNADKIPDFWAKQNIFLKDFDPFAPKYQIVESRIGISLGKTNNLWPNPKEAIKSQQNNKHAPDAILSTQELPNLYMYGHLYQKGWIESPPTTFIQNYISGIKTFIKKVKDGKIPPVAANTLVRERGQSQMDELEKRKNDLNGELQKAEIKLNDLPDAIRDYLLGYKTKGREEHAICFFENMLRKTKRLKDRKESLRVGDMAQELARDIIFLSPTYDYIDKNGEKHKHKLNDQEYDFLQKGLAYFYSYKFEVDKLLKHHTLFNAEKVHPFIRSIHLLKSKSLPDFFEDYMLKKIQWLTPLIKDLNNEQKCESILKQYDYMISSEKEISEKEYFESPLYLPRGIFNKSIIAALKNHDYQLKDTDNVAYAVKLYLEGITQDYYNIPRYYIDGSSLQPPLVLEGLKADKARLHEKDNNRKELHYQIKDIRKSENAIRNQQFFDRIMWLMLKDLFGADQSKIEITNQQLQTVGFNNSENNLLAQELEMEELLFGKYTVYDKLPIKRHGEFRRFLKDRRLENLLEYYGCSKPIARTRLVDELERYDLKRQGALQKIYYFETLVFKYYGKELTVTETDGHKYIVHREYIDFVSDTFGIELPQLGNNLDFAELRNKLLHNQILYDKALANLVDVHSEITVTAQILGIIEQVYDKMIKAIETINP